MIHRKKESLDDEKPELRANNSAQPDKANNRVWAKDALQESQQRQAEVSALLESSRAVLKYREFKDSARSIFDSCKNLIGATAGYVALLSKDGAENEVLFLDSGGIPCTVDPTLPMPIRGLRAEAYRTGKAVYRNNFSNSEWVKLMPDGHASLDNVLFAPLLIEGKAVGLLGLGNKQGGFTENDGHLATTFGELAAIALHNSRTLELLTKSEEKFHSVAQTASDAIFSADSRGNTILWNHGAETIFGYSADEMVGKPISVIIPERLREAHAKGIRRVVSTGKTKIIGKTVEQEALRKNGSEFPVELSLATWKIKDEIFFTAILRDITERKHAEEALRKAHDELEIRVRERTAQLAEANKALQAEIKERTWAEEELRLLNRAHKTLSTCNQTLIRATEEAELLHEICKRMVDVGGYRFAWVGFAEQNEDKTVRPVAQAGYGEGHLENANITWADNERGRGPTGTAIRTGRHSVAKNILTDPNYIPWRAEAIKRGFASAIALPLVANGKPFGALNIYAKEQDAFDAEEIALLTELADDLAYGIMSLRTRTEHKKTEEMQRKLSSAVEHTADIVIITKRDGAIEYVNPAFEKITGYTMEEAVGKTPRILKSGKQDEKFYEHLWGTILSGEVFYGVLINKKKNGELYYAEKTITPVKDGQGNITHFASTDKDITERKKAEETRLENLRLEAADKAKSEFLANMSHELRTPLNAINGFSELMMQGMGGELTEKQKHFIENINSSGTFLLSLINDILDLSKVEAGKIELAPEKMPVPVTIKETLTLIKEKAMKHNVLLKTEFDPKLEFIEADKQRVKQVLFNLLSNAVKFSKEGGGTVTIRAKKEGDMAKVSVSDTGIGIKEENIGRLFQKFEQLESGISQKYGGTGLGLAITKQLVELHGGKIWAESKFGEGSTFTFLLPIVAKRQEKTGSERSQ